MRPARPLARIPARRAPPVQSADRGVTLIELVAVLAIFAMVALIGLQSLTGVIRARERLGAVDARTAALERTLVLLRADLQAAVPLTFAPPGARPGAPPEAALLTLPDSRALAVSVSAPDRLAGAAGDGLARVIWRFDPVARHLSRQVWPMLSPPDPAVQGPAVTMLDGVEGFGIRVLPETGAEWSPDHGRDPARGAARLPRAVELVLATADQGDLRVLVAY